MGAWKLAEKEVTFEIKSPQIIVLLLFLTLIFVLELQVTFGTPISFGDEAFHTRMAQWMAQNVEYPVWMPLSQSPAGKESFSRPPFWNLLEAGFFLIFGFSELIVKFLTPFIAMLIGITIYSFCKKFYNWQVGFIAAVIAVTVPSFVTYSVLFYTDALVTFFIMMFMYMLALSVSTKKRLYMAAAGTFGALALMTKITGGVVYIVVAIVLLYYLIKERKPLSLIRGYAPMLLMLILISGALFVRTYAYHGTPLCYGVPYFGDMFKWILDPSKCYVSNFQPQYKYEGRTEEVGTEMDVFRMGFVNYLEFAYGNIWFVMLAFSAGLFLIFSKTDKVGKIMLLMLALYIPLFLVSTRRAEDTSRYALILLPVISIIAGKYFDSVYEFIKNYQKHIALIVFIVILYLGYTTATAKIAVMSQVKQFSPLFFEACEWVKENTPENSLLSTVWTYRTAYSCQRSITGSEADMALSNNVTHILSTAKQLGVTHIFIQKFSLSNQALSEKYPVSYVQLLEGNSTHFKKVFENGPSLNQCLQQGGCDGNIVYEIVY